MCPVLCSPWPRRAPLPARVGAPCLLLLPALGLGCAEPIALSVVPSEGVSTVLVARWSTPQPSLGTLRWSQDGGEERSLSEQGEPTTEHELVIAGLYAETTYQVRVEAEGERRAWSSEPVAVETGVLPAGLVDFQVTGDAAAFDGLLPLVVDGADPKLVVIDATGEVVWYHRFEEEGVAPRRAVYVPQERRFVVLNHDADRDGDVRWLDLQGQEQARVAVPGGHHDFVVLPDGDLLLISEDIREVDGLSVIGDGIDRVDDQGGRQRVWTLWDHFDLEDSPPPADGDWSHANAIDHLPDAGLVLLGLRHFNSILALDDQDLSLRWSVGGHVGTLQLDESAQFQRQHQFDLLGDDRLLIFDNHANPEEPEESRVVELKLDLEGGMAKETWRYPHDPPAKIDVLGSVEGLPGDLRLVNWGYLGQIQVVTLERDVTWQLDMLLGSVPSYGDVFAGF
ncbi:aryl-sulfate sulfotransferase [Myxococcota bacterium]|nr:aryl-sulfate sulfotransferase [Myxococcota bacterium]